MLRKIVQKSEEEKAEIIMPAADLTRHFFFPDKKYCKKRSKIWNIIIMTTRARHVYFACLSERRYTIWQFCLNTRKRQKKPPQMNKRKPKCNVAKQSWDDKFNVVLQTRNFSVRQSVCLIWVYILAKHPKGNFGL